VKAAADTGSPWLRDLRCKVRARLRAQGATQAGLAWYLGITEKHVSQLLTGKVDGSTEMLGRLAAAVGLRITIADAAGPWPVLPGRRKHHRPRHDAPGYEQVVKMIAATGTEG
jgi:transcriptional regulator with XRE-family HTH domain